VTAPGVVKQTAMQHQTAHAHNPTVFMQGSVTPAGSSRAWPKLRAASTGMLYRYASGEAAALRQQSENTPVHCCLNPYVLPG
jgi:hypothetical protein